MAKCSKCGDEMASALGHSFTCKANGRVAVAGVRGGKLAAQAVQLREIVRRGKRVFLEVGDALAAIHNQKLYRQLGHDTFQEFCEAEGLSRSYAYRLMDGAAVVKMLPMATKSIPESQARELVKARNELGSDAVAEVWEEAGDRPTAKTLRKAVQQRLGSGEVEQACMHPRHKCADCGKVLSAL